MRSRPRQSAPSAARSSLRPAPSRMEVRDSHSVNAGWVTGGPGAEQRDEVGMSQQCGSRRVRGRAEVPGPLAGAPGQRDLSEDEFDQAVEQRGLVRDVPVDRHRVDT